MAINAAWAAFTDPESRMRDMSREQRTDMYSIAWEYYRHLRFSRRLGRDWTAELASRELYKHTRLIYNPVAMIVDFYVDNLWQPARNENFEALVTPLSDKTDEKIVEAVEQIDQWSNFLAEGQKIKRYAAATGNVLVEGIDDLERQKILHKAVWPGYVTEIELNATGDVQAYTLEYDVYDRAIKTTFRYKKVVTKDSFAYFRDDRPFVPDGKTATEEANPYNFCFAVWIRHTDDGGDYGLPACHSLDKVDNVNSLASHIDDFIHKAIESPKLISSNEEILPLFSSARASDGSIIKQDPRLNWMVLKAKQGASVHDLLGLLDLAAVSPELKRQLDSFENDYPELQAAAIIRENSQLSGAALERMLGPAQNRLDGVQANYNQQLIKLRQMQLAVAGMRSTGGGWNTRTPQQQVFRGFGLQSYERGELDFRLQPAILVNETESEREDLLKKKADRAVTLSEIVDEFETLSVAGYSEDQIKDIQARLNAQVEDEPDIDLNVDPAVIEARRLANGGTLPRQLRAGTGVVNA